MNNSLRRINGGEQSVTTAYRKETLDPVDRRVERALLDLKQLVRQLSNALDNAVAVERHQAEGLEDEHVERALQEVRLTCSERGPAIEDRGQARIALSRDDRVL